MSNFVFCQQNAICEKLCFFASIGRKVLLKINECYRKLMITLHRFQHMSTDFDLQKRLQKRWFWHGRQGTFRLAEKVEDEKALLVQDPIQTQEEFAESLNVDRLMISRCLKAIGMIQKQRNWVPYELKPRDIERCKMTCKLLLQRHRRKTIFCIVTDEKWIRYDNPKRKDMTKWFSSTTTLGHMLRNQSRKALNWDILSHSPYSPDIAPSDYHLSISPIWAALPFLWKHQKNESIRGYPQKICFFDMKSIPSEKWEKVVASGG